MGALRLAGCLVEEIGAHAIRRFRPVDQVMAGEDVVLAEPLGRGIEQDLLQRAAMDRELRPFVSGVETARLAPDRLAMLGEVGELGGAHAGGVQPIEQAELGEFAHRMRQAR